MDFERELLSLVEEVHPKHYPYLCIALDVTYTRSEMILTKHNCDVSSALFEVICSWRVKQRDGTNYKRLLADKLRSVHLYALGTKLEEGGYSTQDTRTQSSVADEAQGVNKLTQEEDIRTGWSLELERELLSLVKDVSPGHYYVFCEALDVIDRQSQMMLTKHALDASSALFEIICNWRVKQRDGTNYKRLLADKLRSVYLDALGTKLEEGGYSTQDTATQSSVTDEAQGVNKLRQEEVIRAGWSLDLERELLSLVQNVPAVYYFDLCNALEFSYSQSQMILTKNHVDVSSALFEVICSWGVKQRDGTNYKKLLAEKLKSVHLNALGTKLVEGGYSTQDTPIQSSVADEVHGVNKLTQEEDIGAGWSMNSERELLSLVQDVPHTSYIELCNALNVSYAHSQAILSKHLLDVSIALSEVIYSWRAKQRDGTNYKRLLADKLRSVHLDALGTKLVEGGYSTQDTPTQSSVADEVHRVMKLTQEMDIRAGRRSDLDKELLSLVQDVSPVHYYALCNAIDVSYSQSQVILSKNLLDVSTSLFEVICSWGVKQRGGTINKRLLAEKLRSVHLDALATKLVKGGYSSQDTPTQSSVTDEVYPVNKLTQAERDFRAVWGLDFERELQYLVQDVSPKHYYALCKLLDVSDKKSQMILTQNLFDVSNSLFEVICRWRVKQRDGTNYKRLLAEKLRSVHLDALATKLVKGGYSTPDTPTQSLVAEEVHPVNKLTQEEVIRAWWSSDLEKELLSLIKDVSPVHYYDLCKALDISDKQSNVILTQNLMDVSNSLYEVIYSWRVKQRDGTNYKRFLAEKLRTVQLDALATKLVEGGYSTHGSPTQSSVADEVHPVNKLTQEESLLFEEALMARKESPTKESEKPVESVDDDERVNCFGFTEELSANLLDTKVLTINVEAPEEHEDLTAFPKEQELQYHPELAEEPQYHPPITSWTWNEGQDRTILDLQQSNLPLREVMSCVAQSCPKLHTLRLHANVPVLISEESILESDSTTSVDESDKEDSPEIEIYMRCRQPTDVPFRALLAIVSSIFPKICDLTLDGDDKTKLDISGYTQPLPSSFLPKLRRLCLQQLMGSLCLLTFLKFVVEQLSHLPFLRISQCNVDVQTEIEMEFSESALSHLEIIPVNVIPFACLNKLVFKAFRSIINFIVQHNIAAEHHIYLNWTKTGQMPTEKLYLKQSTPLRAFKDILTIVKKFPRISKLETDECGSFERTELLEIVRTCTQLQYFSSVASGVSRILAISHQFMRKSTSKPISKSFGKLGGELRLETHDIRLCVPEGAIQEEGEIQIILQALINPPSTHFQEDEMVCSFGFQCTIPNSPGFRFAVPVRVTLPHCAILHDPSKVRTGIYHGELWHDTGDVEISTITYVPPSENRLPRCEVDEKEITVIIDHFSFEWPVLNIRNPFVKGKRLGCMPFVPKKMPPTKKPILRVYLFDIVRGNPEEIEKDESKCDFRMARPKIELQARDDLVVTYGMDGSNDHDNKPEQSLRTILFSDIRQLIQNTVDFRLDFSERVEQFAAVNLSVTEGTKNRGNLPFDVDFTGDASGSSRDARADEGMASGVTDEFDEILQSVAESMSKDQEICGLASKLGVKVANYNRFIEENRLHGVTWTGTLNMLRTWRNGIDKSQERARLRNALLCLKQVRLVSTLLPEEGD